MKKQNDLVGKKLTFKELDELMVKQGYESELQYINDLKRTMQKKQIGYTFDMGLTIDVFGFEVINENKKNHMNARIHIIWLERRHY